LLEDEPIRDNNGIAYKASRRRKPFNIKAENVPVQPLTSKELYSLPPNANFVERGELDEASSIRLDSDMYFSSKVSVPDSSVKEDGKQVNQPVMESKYYPVPSHPCVTLLTPVGSSPVKLGALASDMYARWGKLSQEGPQRFGVASAPQTLPQVVISQSSVVHSQDSFEPSQSASGQMWASQPAPGKYGTTKRQSTSKRKSGF
jgi:hypothetical protein